MFDWLRPDVELARDLSPSAWIVSTLEPWSSDGVRLASFMPDGLEAVARVFHPFEDWDGGKTTWRRWSEVGAERRISIDTETSAEEVVGADAVGTQGFPAEGELPEPVCGSLIDILAGETRTPETCWFALWSGWGLLRSGAAYLSPGGPSRKQIRQQRRNQRREEAALGEIPQISEPHGSTGRRYLLFRGPIDAACAFEPMQGHSVSPSFWWPDDRAWTVVTEIDGHSTYVGGTRGAIDTILGSPQLEAIEVDRHVRIG